ncbi:MAG: ATP-grasp fold amidoligase family protein [Rubricella sp.]
MPRCDIDRNAFVARIGRRRLRARMAHFLVADKGARRAAIYRSVFADDAEAVAYHYALHHDHLPDLDEPALFLEKLRWQFLHHPNPLLGLVSDKIAVRAYHAMQGAHLSPPALIASGVHPEELLAAPLPERFVLKASNGCGANHFHLGGTIDRRALVETVRRWFAAAHWARHAELFYRDIPARWLVEEYLPPGPVGEEVKVMCFGGEPVFINHIRRHPDGRTELTPHDLDWRVDLRFLPRNQTPSRDPVPRPEMLDIMLDDARRLSADLIHARIDFLKHGARTAFSEITVSSNGALYSMLDPETDRALGGLMDLATAPSIEARGRAICAALDWPPATPSPWREWKRRRIFRRS